LNLRRVNRAILCGALVVFFGSALVFSTTSSASNGNSWVPVTKASYLPFLVRQIGGAETVETFEANCTTPEDIYILGETVCAVSTNSPPPFNGFRQRRFQWVAPSGVVVKQTDITTNPQNDTYTIPTSGTFAQVGTWTVRLIRNTGATQVLTRFTVKDPNNLQADLSVTKFGPLEVKSGNNAGFTISLTNRGPDDAQAVQLTDVVPSEMTFVSGAQTTGPAFTCTHPSSGGTGTSTCTIATLPRNATATFTFIYEVSAAAAAGSTIYNTVQVSSTTAELNPQDNSATVPVGVTGSGGGAECTLTCPSDISVVAAPGASGAVITYTEPTGVGTSCGAVTCSQASNTFFSVGKTVVVCAAEVGDACSFEVNVADNENPTISCPANITVSEDSPGSGSAIVNYPAPVAADNSGVVEVTCTKASGESFSGTTTVTCTATDEADNSASCSFTVTVTGNGCVLDCPDNIVVDAAPGACNAVVTFDAPTATTECGAVTVSHTSGATFPLGTTTVTVSSEAGNSCSFTITVRDVTPPTISCPADISVAAVGTTCAATVNPGTATGSDSCGPVTIVGIRSDGEPIASTHYTVGTTTITWTATDGAGNQTSCSQTITVSDTSPPTVSLNVPPAVLQAVADANCQALIPDLGPYINASDTCTPAANLTIIQSPAADTVVGKGNHTITVTVIEGDPDGVNNTATATATFTVVDGTPPVLTVNGPNPLVVECHTTLVDPGATATDNCVANPAVTSTNNVNMNVPGNYTINYSTTDGTNTVTASRAVTVVDTTAPTLTLNGSTINLWPPNHAYHTINLTQFVTGASDGCDGGVDINDVVISKVTSDEPENSGGDGNTLNDIVIAANCKSVQLRSERQGNGNGRVYTIHFRLRDASGNTTTATAQVKVPKSQGNNGGAVDSGVQYTVNSSCP
jgi:uncharacterized repeat protein (TIGR01451 family)